VIGQMRERIVLQSPDPVAVVVASLTQVAGLATATTARAHGFATGDYITTAGATPAGYCGRFQVTVTGTKTFTYVVAANLATPATGTITATYARDALGGTKVGWTTVDTVAAEIVPIRAAERLQAAAIQAVTGYRFRIYARGDVTAKWRALWTPSQPAGSPEHTLELHGVIPDGDGRRFMLIECSEVRA
jgi:head-tail adaptor